MKRSDYYKLLERIELAIENDPFHASFKIERYNVILIKLKNENRINITTNLTAEKIKYLVGRFFNMPDNWFNTKSRKRELVQSRQIAMTLISKNVKGLSLDKIGSMFGNRDHATVLHAKQTVSNLIYSNKKFRDSYADLIQYMNKRKFISIPVI